MQWNQTWIERWSKKEGLEMVPIDFSGSFQFVKGTKLKYIKRIFELGTLWFGPAIKYVVKALSDIKSFIRNLGGQKIQPC